MVSKFNSLLNKKSISLFEIFVLFFGILAIGWAIGSEVRVVSGAVNRGTCTGPSKLCFPYSIRPVCPYNSERIGDEGCGLTSRCCECQDGMIFNEEFSPNCFDPSKTCESKYPGRTCISNTEMRELYKENYQDSCTNQAGLCSEGINYWCCKPKGSADSCAQIEADFRIIANEISSKTTISQSEKSGYVTRLNSILTRLKTFGGSCP